MNNIINERIKKIFDLGLIWDGQSFQLEDFNIHYTEVLCDAEPFFVEKIEKIEKEMRQRNIQIKSSSQNISEVWKDLDPVIKKADFEQENNESENTGLSLINPIESIISADKISQNDISNLAEDIVGKILEESHGKKELIIFEAIKKLTEEICKGLRSNVLVTELETIKGVLVENMRVAERLNYEEDPVWFAINKKLKDREQLLKRQYKNKKTHIADGDDFEGIKDDDGNIVPVITQKSGGQTTIKLTFPKY
jgi:hypothetical protein